MNKKYVVVSILIGCIVGSIFVYFFRRTEDNRASDVHYKTVLHNTAQPAEKHRCRRMMLKRHRGKYRK